MGRVIHTFSVGIKMCRSKMCVSDVKTAEARDGFKRAVQGKPGESSGRNGVRLQHCENSCFDLQ